MIKYLQCFIWLGLSGGWAHTAFNPPDLLLAKCVCLLIHVCPLPDRVSGNGCFGCCCGGDCVVGVGSCDNAEDKMQ